MTESDGAGGTERLFTGDAGRLSLALGVGIVAVNLGRQTIPPLLPTIIADLGITPSEAGFALSALGGGFAVIQYLSGRLADELSRATVLVGSLVVVALGFGLLSLATSYPLLVGSTTVVGAGAGAYVISMRISLSDLFVALGGVGTGGILLIDFDGVRDVALPLVFTAIGVGLVVGYLPRRVAVAVAVLIGLAAVPAFAPHEPVRQEPVDLQPSDGLPPALDPEREHVYWTRQPVESCRFSGPEPSEISSSTIRTPTRSRKRRVGTPVGTGRCSSAASAGDGGRAIRDERTVG